MGLFFAEIWGFLCCIQCTKTLLLSYLNQHSNIFSDFSPQGGTLIILGWSKVTRSEKNGWKKKWTKWSRKMGGRSFLITTCDTSGAFGGTLLCGEDGVVVPHGRLPVLLLLLGGAICLDAWKQAFSWTPSGPVLFFKSPPILEVLPKRVYVRGVDIPLSRFQSIWWTHHGVILSKWP